MTPVFHKNKTKNVKIENTMNFKSRHDVKILIAVTAIVLITLTLFLYWQTIFCNLEDNYQDFANSRAQKCIDSGGSDCVRQSKTYACQLQRQKYQQEWELRKSLSDSERSNYDRLVKEIKNMDTGDFYRRMSRENIYRLTDGKSIYGSKPISLIDEIGRDLTQLDFIKR